MDVGHNEVTAKCYLLANVVMQYRCLHPVDLNEEQAECRDFNARSVAILTHCTMLNSPSMKKLSVGRFPVRISSSTMPKLYTSPFSVIFPVSMYSVPRNMHRRQTGKNQVNMKSMNPQDYIYESELQSLIFYFQWLANSCKTHQEANIQAFQPPLW